VAQHGLGWITEQTAIQIAAEAKANPRPLL